MPVLTAKDSLSSDTTGHEVLDTIRISGDTIVYLVKHFSRGRLTDQFFAFSVPEKKCADCKVKLERKAKGEKATFILIRNEGMSDKSWGPFLIVRNKLTPEDSEVVSRLFKRQRIRTDYMFKYNTFVYENGSFNLIDTLVCNNVSNKLIKQSKDFGFIGIYSGTNGKLRQYAKLQKHELAVKHFQRVCSVLSTTGDYKKLISAFEELICLEWGPCDR